MARKVTEQVVEVPLDRVAPNPWQPRTVFNQAKLEELARSIEAQGLIQPITVRKHPAKEGWYQIAAGERRTRASRLIKGQMTIRAFVKEISDLDMRKVGLLENVARDDLNPIDEARGVKELLDTGMSIIEIAREIGRNNISLMEEQNLLCLLPEIQQQVAVGNLEKKIGIALGKMPKEQAASGLEKGKRKGTGQGDRHP